MIIRNYKNGDELELYEDFYSKNQLEAWAPKMTDEISWKKRILGIKPFILEDDGIILGYANIQNNGYIDHFFVRGNYDRMEY